MDTVVFDEGPRITVTPKPTRGLTGWLIRSRIVQTPSQANILLGGITLLCFLGALLLFHQTVTAEKIDPLKNFVPAYSTH